MLTAVLRLTQHSSHRAKLNDAGDINIAIFVTIQSTIWQLNHTY